MSIILENDEGSSVRAEKMLVCRKLFPEQESEITLPVVVFNQLKKIAKLFPKICFEKFECGSIHTKLGVKM